MKNSINNSLSITQMTAAYNTVMAENFKKVLISLRDKNIPVILLKGITFFILSKDQSSFDRQMGDIDILVRQNDLERTKQILIAEGYSFVHGNMANAEVYGIFEPIEMYIDLHVSLTNPSSPTQKNVYLPDENSLWRRAKMIDFGDSGALTLSNEDTLIYLCFHALKERFSDDKWLKDIASLFQFEKNKFDNALFFKTARAAGTLKLCLFVLAYISRYFDVKDLPFEVKPHEREYKFYAAERSLFFLIARIKTPFLLPLKNFLWLLAMDSTRKKTSSIANLFPYLLTRRSR